MSIEGRISTDNRSYRQGLVLGLTMAEVILLLLFALLIAIASLWRNERVVSQKLAKDNEALRHATVPIEDGLSQSLRKIAASPKKVELENAVKAIEEGKAIDVLSAQEHTFVDDVRKMQVGVSRQEIDDNWRTLILATKNVAKLTYKVSVADLVEHYIPEPERNIASMVELASVARKELPGADANYLRKVIIEGAQNLKQGEHDWPPIITLSETKGFSFDSGRAEVSDSFRIKLATDIIPMLVERAKRFRVDVIEVVGHTDEQVLSSRIPNVPRTSNLDSNLLNALNGGIRVSGLAAADNAGLGLARAVSVVRELMASGNLTAYKILPLSGGQLIETNDSVTRGGGGNAKERRRIEIRLRRSVQEQAAPASGALNLDACANAGFSHLGKC